MGNTNDRSKAKLWVEKVREGSKQLETTKFTYKDRNVCICGRPSQQADKVIEKSFKRGRIKFVRCKKCSTWFQSPQITIDSLQQWYNSSDYYASNKGAYLNYFVNEEHRRIEAQARYKRDLSSFLLPCSKVLEVGCATGSLLSVLRTTGHVITGLDLSTEFAHRAKSLNGIDVVVSDFLDFNHENEYFDLIIMLGTISNLHNLPLHLSHANKLLKKKGFLYFNMPVANSLIAKLYGKHLWMFVPSVSNFLSKKGCAIVLKKASFKIIKTRTDLQQPGISKLLGHARLGMLYRLAEKINISKFMLPVPVPIPGVEMVWAQKESDV